MKILVLQMEKKREGHIVFVPPLPSDSTVICLPPEVSHIIITADGDINHIYAVDESEVGYFE